MSWFKPSQSARRRRPRQAFPAALPLIAGTLAVGVLAAVFTNGCSRKQNERYNLLLITLDTTRADHLGCYGYGGAATPAIDSIAAHGVLAEQAFCSAPLTLPSHATMMTGLLPPEHGLRINSERSLSKDTPTLASILAANGYSTAAFVASSVLSAKFGLNNGFNTYDDSLPPESIRGRELGSPYRSGDNVTDAALNWLRRHGKKEFFCWVHLYDPHSPYYSHESLFGDRYTNMPYDAEIAFVDIQVGRLMAGLNELGVAGKTLVVVSGDHGESLPDDHHYEPRPYHGYMLYNGTMRVPLLFSLPNRIAGGRRLMSLVTLADIFPTTLTLLGIRTKTHARGRDLSQELQSKGNPSAVRSAEAEKASDTSYGETLLPATYGWAGPQSLMTREWKYIRTPKAELYDLRSDPGELTNLAEHLPTRVSEMEKQLASLERGMSTPSTKPLAMTREDRKRIESLGYVSGGVSPTPPLASARNLKDIKDMLGVLNLNREADDFLRGGDYVKAIELLRRVVDLSPETPVFVNSLCCALADGGHAAEAVERLAQLKSCLENEVSNERPLAHGTERPLYLTVINNLAYAMGKDGKFAEALPLATKAAEGDPGNAAFHHTRATVYRGLGRLDKADSCTVTALSYEPANVEFMLYLAELRMELGRKAEASVYARRVLELGASEKQRALAVTLLEKSEGVR